MITDAQSVQLEKIFQSFVAALKSGMTDVDRYQKDVSKLMAEPSASEVDVIQAINRLEAAKADLGRTRSLMLFRMYRLLTPEQRIGHAAVRGTLIGYLAVTTIVTVIGLTAHLAFVPALGIALFCAFWGGPGFGGMLGATLAVTREQAREDAARSQSPTVRDLE